MDLGTAIVGSTCVTICALPFVLTGINRKKNEMQLVATLKNTAKKNASEISQYEICGNYAIGIDTTKSTLSFVTKIDDAYKTLFVELSSVIDCKIANISRSTKGGKIIQRLYLQLSYADRGKHEVILEFYNADISFQLSGEVESINKWNTLINNLLNH